MDATQQKIQQKTRPFLVLKTVDFKTYFLTRKGNAQKIIIIIKFQTGTLFRIQYTFFTFCIKGVFVCTIQYLILILTKLENGL